MKTIFNIGICMALAILPYIGNTQTTPLYFPNKVVSPGFREKGEVLITADIKPSISENETDFLSAPSVSINLHPGIHFACSPIQNVMVYGAYDWLINRGGTDLNVNTRYSATSGSYRGGKIEIGLGYYKSLGNKGVLEASVGYGNGGMNGNGTGMYVIDSLYYQQITMSNDFSGRYHVFAIQAAVGLCKQSFAIKGGIRYSVQRYYSFAYDNSNTDKFAEPTMKQAYINGTTNSYIQPYFDMMAGGKNFVFNLQPGLMFPMIGNSLVMDNTVFYLTVGIGFRHNPSWKDRK